MQYYNVSPILGINLAMHPMNRRFSQAEASKTPTPRSIQRLDGSSYRYFVNWWVVSRSKAQCIVNLLWQVHNKIYFGCSPNQSSFLRTGILRIKYNCALERNRSPNPTRLLARWHGDGCDVSCQEYRSLQTFQFRLFPI